MLGSLNNSRAVTRAHITTYRHTSAHGSIKRHTAQQSPTGRGTSVSKKHTPHAKLKRSKSSSPKRVGQNAKQRVLLENFNPDNADWIRGADNLDDGN